MPNDILAQIDRFSIAILRLLASEPLRSYYQREVARVAGVSVGKTNQVLRRLESDELVSRERRGNVDLYSYNLHSPAGRYLKIVFNLSEVDELRGSGRGVSNEVVRCGSGVEGYGSKVGHGQGLLLDVSCCESSALQRRLPREKSCGSSHGAERAVRQVRKAGRGRAG